MKRKQYSNKISRVSKVQNQVNSLRFEKQNLDAQNQALLLALDYLKQITSFLSGSSMSLRNEMVSIISIIAYTIHSLNREVQRRPMLQQDNGDPHNFQFAPLNNAANGEEVDLIELKNSLAKAIMVRQRKLNSSGKLDEILSDARLALSAD